MKTPTEKSEEVKKDNPEQSRRFVETAKAVECEESGEAFDVAINRIKSGHVPDSSRARENRFIK
jgi:hypothetical protein